MSTRARFWTVSSGCTSRQASRALRNRQVSPDSFSSSAPQSSPRHLYAEPRRPREALRIRPGRCQQCNHQASPSPECSPHRQQPFPSRQPGRGTSGSRQWSDSRTYPSQARSPPKKSLTLLKCFGSMIAWPPSPPPFPEDALWFCHHSSSDGPVKVRRQLFKLLGRHFHAVKPAAPPPCGNTWCAE